MHRTASILILASLLAGCAIRPSRRNAATAPPAATAPSDPFALLTLEQIEPAAQLPAPSTLPSESPPLEALELYARARDSLLQNQRFSAINLLEKAISLDPSSFELNYTLGRVYLSVGMGEKSLAAFQSAAKIEPNDINVQAELGRAYYARGDLPRATEHLRLARLTDEYKIDDVAAAIVDQRLAVVLEQKGYHRAALELYDELLKRLAHPTPAMRSNPEVAYLLAKPESLLVEIGRLYEKFGRYEQAFNAYEFVLQRSPDELANQSRVINLLIAMRRDKEALARAADAVRRFHASPESLALLRQTYHQLDRDADIIGELQKLHRAREEDRAILFALADALESAGRSAEAESLLMSVLREHEKDTEVIARLVQFLAQRGQMVQAARLLIESASKNPEINAELEPQWLQLVRATRRDALRLEQIRALQVAPEAESAKWYYVRRIAQGWSREMQAREAIERSVRISPPFPPALRAMAAQIWADQAYSETVKIEQTQALMTTARAAGRADLADELEGMMLLGRNQPDEAIKLLTRASQARPPVPETQLALAAAFRAAQNNARFEQLLWRLISDHPRFEDPHAALVHFYFDQKQLNSVRRALSVWLVNLPQSIEARLLEARLRWQAANQRDQAEKSLLELFKEHADDARVLLTLREFYSRTERPGALAELLESEVNARPWNYVAVVFLVELHAIQDHNSDGARVLDAAREAVSGDPDRLYLLAQLYQRVDQPQMVERVLEDVLKADPSYAPAGNDLGYTWAEAGTNLDRAEALIRRAVEAEPNNPMFLDSLGWVMYKRGEFEQARQHLEQAVVGQNYQDPIVLDHLGDVMYRLNRMGEAAKLWQQALSRLGDGAERSELKTLRLQLNEKLQQSAAGQPVNTAPVVETPSAPHQAKN